MGDNVDKETYKSLCDPSHALLEKFKVVAPASFKHCLNVSNLCDSVANELPEFLVDRDRLRCSAVYHDIGKIFNPKYFFENLTGDEENPHDKLDPYISYQLISRHVSDGVAILMECEFPVEIIRNILHHHGNSVVHYFFCKSKDVEEDVYRYKFASPPTVESAILMICDIVESTAKAKYPNGEIDDLDSKIKLVSNTIESLTDDGQIDKLELGVVRVIRRILPRELEAIYHKRPEYPSDDKKVGKKALPASSSKS